MNIYKGKLVVHKFWFEKEFMGLVKEYKVEKEPYKYVIHFIIDTEEALDYWADNLLKWLHARTKIMSCIIKFGELEYCPLVVFKRKKEESRSWRCFWKAIQKCILYVDILQLHILSPMIEDTLSQMCIFRSKEQYPIGMKSFHPNLAEYIIQQSCKKDSNLVYYWLKAVESCFLGFDPDYGALHFCREHLLEAPCIRA